MPVKITDDQLPRLLHDHPGWTVEGGQLARVFVFGSYLDGVEFARRVAIEAEALNHHPDIHIGWRKVTLRVSTHSAMAITTLDFDFVERAGAVWAAFAGS
ncbi:MAG TPA: 4a-hydroxytetrahydrobiopterin dehydratase [Verrucomicrobiales bacterium]|nr:4a-hydroxytetrahydrobiopterin dehydratase [Verrucomicrobiales bacterium]